MKYKKFYNNIRVQDVYCIVNNVPFNLMDRIFVWGLKSIDSITVTLKLIKFVENFTLNNW